LSGSKALVLDALRAQVGEKYRLKDGSVVELTENPMDGIWLFCRILSSPDASRAGLEDQPVYAEEIVATAE
jgi:hypothetical protein